MITILVDNLDKSLGYFKYFNNLSILNKYFIY